MARAACTSAMMHYIKRLIKKYTGKKSGFSTNPIGSLAAQMLQLWANSFDPRYLPHFSEAYRRLLQKGLRFPAPADGFKEQITYRPVKSTTSSSGSSSSSRSKSVMTSGHAPQSSSSSSKNGDRAIPSNVRNALDSIGEFLGFVFSITEDPNAPLPEDLLKPSMKSLGEHAAKIAELIDSNIGNEDVVRRLLEVNDQLDAASKRLQGHRNVIDAESSDDDSSSDEEDYRRSKKGNDKSRSAPNIAQASDSVISQSRKSSKSKTRSSSTTKPQQTTSSSTNDLFLLFDPAAPVATPASPSNTSITSPSTQPNNNGAPYDAFDFSLSTSAFDFSSSSSAFAPAGTWAPFEAPQPYNAFSASGSAVSSPPPAQHNNHNSPFAANGTFTSSYDSLPARTASNASVSSTTAPYSPSTPTHAQPALDAFNPFALSSPQSPAQTPSSSFYSNGHSTASQGTPTQNGFHTNAQHAQNPSSTSTPPPNSQSTQRLANTFGKYWSNPETAPAATTASPQQQGSTLSLGGGISPQMATQPNDYFAPRPDAQNYASSTNIYATHSGPQHPVVATQVPPPKPVTTTSSDFNPFL